MFALQYIWSHITSALRLIWRPIAPVLRYVWRPIALVLRYIWRHRDQIMIGITVLSIAALTFVPPLHAVTRQPFDNFWRLVGSDAYKWILPLALFILLLGVWLNNMLEKRNYRWLEWTMFTVKGNIIYNPIKWKRLGWLYVPALVFCMPLLALCEEIIFRDLPASYLGTAVMLLVSGPVFAIIHILSGVTVRMTIYQTLVGLAFMGTYLASGLVGAFMLHAGYNAIAITWVTFELRVRRPLGRALKRYAATRRHLPTITAWLLLPPTTAIH